MVTAVRGAEKLEALGRRLKAAGGTQLRKDLLRGIRESNKGTIRRIREAAAEDLPSSGGLAAQVAASRFGTRSRLSGKSAGVTITGTGKSIRALRQLNDGRLRHPVYGNRKVWVEQQVKPGWFTDTIKEDLPQIRSSIQKVMADIARRIERG